MKYLCLIYNEEGKLTDMPQAERDALAVEVLAYHEELAQRGHLVAAEDLEPVRAATTVRVAHGSWCAAEGPFAETNLQLGGLIVIDARDLNEAVRLASRIPGARFGCVEVRPVKDSGAITMRRAR